MSYKRIFNITILIFLTTLYLFVLSCPNDQMRDLVEIKVSDPIADTFIINDGTPTAARTVTLYSDVSKEEDALEMRFKNEGFSWSEWESYSSAKAWTLPMGDSIKKIYAEYRDQGHHVVSMSNTIELDTVAPGGEGFFVWGSGIATPDVHNYINTESCTIFNNVTGANRMRFSNSPVSQNTAAWDAVSSTVPYADTYSWTLPSGDGPKTVYSQFLDAADLANYYTYTIELDETDPSASEFIINSDAAIASNTAVTLSYSYTDANSVWAEYRNDGESWMEWDLLSGGSESKNWILKSAIGERTVFLKLTDIAGNEAVFSDQIYLDNAAPGVPVVSVDAVSYTYTPEWSWSSGGGGSGNFRYKLDNNDFTSGYTETAETAYTPSGDLPSGDHTLYVQEKDTAGNWSNSGSATTNIDDSFSLSISVSPASSGTTDPVTTTAALNIAENISATPAAGYDFSHWKLVSGSGVSFTDANSQNTQITLSAGDAAIQAVFTLKTYTISVQSTAGGTTSSSGTATHGVPYAISATPNTGYHFDHWSVSSGTGVSIASSGSTSTTATLTSGNASVLASFNLNTYTVNFNTQGGSIVSSQIISYGTTVSPPADPGRGGFTFGGWYKEASCTNPWNFATDSITGATTIYAKWNYIVYAIRSTGPAGGLIFYENPSWATDGWRYLEAAPVSTEWSNIQWGKYGTQIGGTGTDIGTGPSNTQAIVTGLAIAPAETGRAAQWCNSLGYNGFYDWFLPSRSEGYEMIRQLFAYDLGGFKSAAFPGVFYWTSSESGTTGLHANVIQVITGPDYDYDDHPKDNSAGYDYYVRAVRRF